MSRNYLNSHQFTLDDQAFCERMDRHFPAENGPSDMAAAGGLPPLSAHDDPLNPIPKGET